MIFQQLILVLNCTRQWSSSLTSSIISQFKMKRASLTFCQFSVLSINHFLRIKRSLTLKRILLQKVMTTSYSLRSSPRNQLNLKKKRRSNMQLKKLNLRPSKQVQIPQLKILKRHPQMRQTKKNQLKKKKSLLKLMRANSHLPNQNKNRVSYYK